MFGHDNSFLTTVHGRSSFPGRTAADDPQITQIFAEGEAIGNVAGGSFFIYPLRKSA
jgi:hypothetical protein